MKSSKSNSRAVEAPTTLQPGDEHSEDAVFIVRDSLVSPRLAVKAVRGGATIQFGLPEDPAHAITFIGDSPFKESEITLGSTYQIREDASGLYRHQVAGHLQAYELNVHETGEASAVFNWEGELIAQQRTTSNRMVVFARAEAFDDTSYEGEIKIVVDDAPDSYTDARKLLVPADQPKGRWKPGVDGQFRVRVVKEWGSAKAEAREDTGSDDGDIFIDPPPEPPNP